METALGRGDVDGFVKDAPRPPALIGTPCGSRAIPVPGAVVFLEDVHEPFAPTVEPPRPVELRFDRCALTPGLVLAAGPAAEIAISSLDPVRHELTIALAPSPGAPPGAVRRVPLPLEGQRFVLTQTGPGVLQLGCALHEHERATVILPAHRHHTLTDLEGRFHLADVPVGKHRLVAWSPDGRRTEGEAAVPPNGSASLEMSFAKR